MLAAASAVVGAYCLLVRGACRFFRVVSWIQAAGRQDNVFVRVMPEHLELQDHFPYQYESNREFTSRGRIADARRVFLLQYHRQKARYVTLYVNAQTSACYAVVCKQVSQPT
jgi:hypothetical protein